MNGADIKIITRNDFLTIVDVGDVDLPLDLDLYSSLRFARKLLIVRRKGEPRDSGVKEAIDTFSLVEDFFKQKEIKPMGKIRCELDRMEDIKGVINAIEKASKIKVDDEIKEEICNICISSDGKHSILGFIKAIFIGFASLKNIGEIEDFITANEFRRIGGMKLKEYKASEKRLEHIYTWLDDDIKKLLKVFKFLNEKIVHRPDFEKKIVEKAYRAYHGEEIPEIAIEKAKNIEILQEKTIDLPDSYEFMSRFLTEMLSREKRIPSYYFSAKLPTSVFREIKQLPSYCIWHPWQIEIIELHKESSMISDRFMDELKKDEDSMILALKYMTDVMFEFLKKNPPKKNKI